VPELAKSERQKKESAEPSIDNRRARFEYEFLDRLEAGIVLTGTEIKSIRSGGASIAEAYARVREGELWLLGMHVPPYKEGSFSNHEPRRPRKLLVHRAARRREGADASPDPAVLQARKSQDRHRAREGQKNLGQAPRHQRAREQA
jgi:SsrA-binding protein